MAFLEAVLCGERKGLETARLLFELIRELSLVISILSFVVSGGRSERAHLARAVLPLPGGPLMSKLCRPAIAIVSARFAWSCPII